MKNNEFERAQEDIEASYNAEAKKLQVRKRQITEELGYIAELENIIGHRGGILPEGTQKRREVLVKELKEQEREGGSLGRILREKNKAQINLFKKAHPKEYAKFAKKNGNKRR